MKHYQRTITSFLVFLTITASIYANDIPNENDIKKTKITNIRSMIEPMSIAPLADSFVMIYNDTIEAGYMLNKITLTESEIILWDVSTFGRAVREEATCILDRKTLQTKSMEISGTFGQGPLDTKLQWNGTKVEGYRAIQSADTSLQGREEISREFAEETITRSEFILCYVRSMPLEIGMKFPLNLYACLEDTLWDVNISVESKEKVTVPAGEFMTYKIVMTNGKPSNTYYVTDTTPMRLVRVDIEGMPLRIELAGKIE